MKNKKKTSRTVFRSVLLVFISLVLGVSVYMWNAHRLTNNAMPMPFGWGMSVVLTGSMESELSPGDLVIIREAEDYEIGDIVVYQSGHELIIHRIIDIDGETLTTMGDANNTPDDPIKLDAIKGRLVFSIPFIGRIVNIIKTPVGIIVILFAAFALLESSYRREKARDTEDIEKIKEEIRRLRGSDDSQGS